MNATNRLTLQFLGAPRIERDGRPVTTDTRKAVALLAYLALTGAYHTRDELGLLLWPEMDAGRSRAALRRTLSALKRAIGDEHLYITRDGMSLEMESGIWSDVSELENAVAALERHAHKDHSLCDTCGPALVSAVESYDGDFLTGFSLRDSVEFDDWQLVQAERLRRLYLVALQALVKDAAAAGDYAQAIEYAHRWVTADPLREEAHRWLMQLYAWDGSREAALRQYRESVRVLSEELGVDPLPETTALYEAIQEGKVGRLAPATPLRPAAAAASLPEGRGAFPDRLPLIGRQAAIDALQTAYDQVGDAGRIAAIVGEGGIGKSYLAEGFMTMLRQDGARVALSACYEGESSLAYAPFASALRGLLRQPEAVARISSTPQHWLVEVARLVPEFADYITVALPPVEAQGPAAQTRFFAAVSEVLCHLLAGDRPGALLIDDAHWADDASLDLLAYLARRLTELPVLLLITWPEVASGLDHPLPRLLAEAQRSQTGRLITLQRWAADDVAELVSLSLPDGTPSGETGERLFRETEGLPYFVVEYWRRLARQPDDWTMPQSVRDLLLGRLADIDSQDEQILQTAAIIGRSFDYDILQAASGRSEEEAVGGLEQLLAQGLVREVPGNDPAGQIEYDFSHQQLRSLVYESVTLARRRLLHRRVAEALVAQTRAAQRAERASQIAGHFRLAGHEETAATYYEIAGDFARSLYANHEALEQYETALAMGNPDVSRLQTASGDMHLLLGAYSAALRAYESAAAVAPRAELSALEHKIGQVYERRGDWELADSHYRAAVAALDDSAPPATLALILVDRSRVAYRLGDPAGATAFAEEALVLASDDEAAAAQVHNTLGLLARQRGELEAARDHLERSLALAGQSATLAARVAALNNLARLQGLLGDDASALDLLEQALALCTRQGDRHHEAALYNHRADLLHAAGREEEAMASLKQAVAIYAEIGLESGDWQPEIWKLTEW